MPLTIEQLRDIQSDEMADDLALGRHALVAAGAGALCAFVGGAAVSALMVNWARRRGLESLFALPLALEAALLAGFGLFGAGSGTGEAVLSVMSLMSTATSVSSMSADSTRSWSLQPEKIQSTASSTIAISSHFLELQLGHSHL